MLRLADGFRDVLVPVLIVIAALLLLLLLLLVGQRGLREIGWRRLEALKRRYVPIVNDFLSRADSLNAQDLRRLSRRHRNVIADVVLAHLRVVRGTETQRGREITDSLGLTAKWRRQLGNPPWWRQARAALALGLVCDNASLPGLMLLLDHHHDQVRAAAIDALGYLGDGASLATLIARMGDPFRYERARVVQALRAFGSSLAPALIERAAANPSERALVATVLAHVGGVAASSVLLEWAADLESTTRAAAWRAISVIGLSDRAFYHALKALRDSDSGVRASAAQALAHAGRVDASDYLAEMLDDDWEVAAQAAKGLGRLGPRGLAALKARAAGTPGPGYDLAWQVLWESDPH